MYPNRHELVLHGGQDVSLHLIQVSLSIPRSYSWHVGLCWSILGQTDGINCASPEGIYVGSVNHVSNEQFPSLFEESWLTRRSRMR